MRSVGVVVDPPFFDDLAGVVEVGKQVRVQTLIAQPSVEALDKPVPHRLAGRDVMPFLPCQHRVRGELAAVVADDHRGQPRLSMI